MIDLNFNHFFSQKIRWKKLISHLINECTSQLLLVLFECSNVGKHLNNKTFEHSNIIYFTVNFTVCKSLSFEELPTITVKSPASTPYSIFAL